MPERDRSTRGPAALFMSMFFVISMACESDSTSQPAPPVALTTEPLTLDDPPTDVTAMEFIPGRAEVFMATRAGVVHHLRIEEGGATRVQRFEVPLVHIELDCGLISMAFAPDFAAKPALYVGQCTSKTESAIRRLPLDPETLTPVVGADVDVFRAGDPAAPRPWHNVGAIGFEPDGTLWALFGDKSVRKNGQALDNPLGALVRMVPEPDEAGATPAPDNPWVATSGRNPYLYAVGLRSPWRGTRDSDGRWFIGDVGENTFEEIDVVTAPGQNFGWSEHEGPCKADCDPQFTDPAIAWDRSDAAPFVLDDPEAEPSASRVVWVGPSYDDTRIDRYGGLLDGRILYGDLCVGFMRGVVFGDAVVDDRPLGHLPGATAMALGPDGYLYAATFGRCETSGAPQPTTLLRLIPAP